MPAQKGTSVLAKLGTAGRGAFEGNKGNAATFDAGGDLPPGMSGIARLVEAKFDVFKQGANTGKPYFYAAGIVVTPRHFKDAEGNEHITEGQRTSIMEPLCDTPGSKGKRKTLNEHFAWVINELKKLGLATEELDYDSLEMAVAALKQASPSFRFRTWRGDATPEFPDPRTNHVWNGAVSEELAPSANGAPHDAVDDSTGGNEVPDPVPDAEAPALPEDLRELVTIAADESDERQGAAIEALKAAAEAAGLATDDESPFAATDNWDDAVAMIEAAQQGDPGALGGEPEVEWEPKKDDVYHYTPMDPKTKKPMVNSKTKKKLRFECSVTAVDKKTKTVTLKNVDDGKTIYKGVKWEALEGQ